MIFKTRRIPRHLIIEDYSPTRRGSRFSILKIVFFTLVAVSATYMLVASGHI